MLTYILRRVFELVPVLFIVSLIVFSVMHILPGDPAQLMLAGAEGGGASAERIEELGGRVEDRRRFGTLVVSISQAAVGEICELDGLAVVETDNAVTIDPDGAGEDIEYDVE